MAIKTFTTGEVLTASDTNTYLANSGLVYVTSATIGSGVSSVTVSNCFSSTYDNYRIIYSGGVGTASPQALQIKMGSTAAGYYNALSYVSYSTGATSTAVVNNGSQWSYVGEASSALTWVCIDVLNPFLTKYTQFGGSYVGSVAGNCGGYLADTTSYTAFSLISPTTLTGGTITVYGYRKA